MIFIGIDIETGGPVVTKHPLVSIGVAIVDQDGLTIDKKRFPIPFNRKDFDSNCMKEFWQNEKNNPGITKMLDMFEKEGKKIGSMEKALGNFYEWFLTTYEKYPDAQLISDFSEFDIGWINYAIGKYLNKPHLGFIGRGKKAKFTNISRSVGSFYHALVPENEENRWSGKEKAMKQLDVTIPVGRVIHDHCPENDAEALAVSYALIHKKHFILLNN